VAVQLEAIRKMLELRSFNHYVSYSGPWFESELDDSTWTSATMRIRKELGFQGSTIGAVAVAFCVRWKEALHVGATAFLMAKAAAHAFMWGIDS
jgi:hypothetical protein